MSEPQEPGPDALAHEWEDYYQNLADIEAQRVMEESDPGRPWWAR